MRWSVSKSKEYQNCPRKWYLSTVFANSRAKDPLRKETFLLKQLRSVYAWRGLIVDIAIDKVIIPALKNGIIPKEEDVLKFAFDLSDQQLDFGKKQKYKQEGMVKSKAGDLYCAFFELEYGNGLDDILIEKMKEEIKVAISNLLKSEIIYEIKNADRIISQRSLIMSFDEFSITSTPDLILFYNDKPPTIIDWKVHSGRNTDYWLQLGTYAYVLSNVKPHVDFPNNFKDLVNDAHKIKLIEFQLLKNLQKVYQLTEEDICDIEDHMYLTGTHMLITINNVEDNLSNIPTTSYPSCCEFCNFKKMCMELNKK
ncbi:MAG: PD-(D/E)XK nuclease family protein [Candidatus Cloacimonetes bacterium]|nr:PD-(D/E)XK nuclease family protein [Candidatus Cloacimonadota bacterium]